MNNKLCILVPCYNEQEVITETTNQLCSLLNNLKAANLIALDSKIMFINDGSNDNTWDMLERIQIQNSDVSCIKLSKNVGHQNALYAGMMLAKDSFDMIISIDADLQDDLSVIEKFIQSYQMGSEIVYGVRKERQTDTFMKRTTAIIFYKLMQKLGVDIVYNHADYRLMSKKSLEALSLFTETNLFLRGIIPQLGFKIDTIYYNRQERFAGTSKYNLGKMFALAWNGITSFSIRPIRFISSLGFIVTLIGILYMIYILSQETMGNTVSGWASLITSVWILGGIQIFSIGIIGEYIGKIYIETKRRPKYIIDKILGL